jgi:hypothetical protein
VGGLIFGAWETQLEEAIADSVKGNGLVSLHISHHFLDLIDTGVYWGECIALPLI